MTFQSKGIHEDNSRTALADYAGQSSHSKTFPQYLAAIIATLGAFSAGTCLSWSSPALPLLLLPQFPYAITIEQASWICSVITLGAFAGAIPAGLFANFLGRKRTLQLLALPMFASWLLIITYSCAYGLIVARFLAGFVIGAYSVVIPMYVAELAEAKIRGTLGTLFQLQITAGILFQYLIGITENFRLIALVPAVVPIVFLIAFGFMPESPVYLSNRGRIDDARRALQWFRGDAYDIDDEITRIKDQIHEQRNNKARLSDIWRSKSATKGMIIALGLMMFQQLSGINAVIFYTEAIFADADLGMPLYVPSLIIGTVMVLATYASTIIIDRAGRRILLLISVSVMALCLASLSFYFQMQLHHDMELPSVVPLLSVAIYMTVFSLGFGPIPWMMLGELFSAKMKGMASSVSAAFNWILAFTVTKMFGNLVDNFGSSCTFALFSAICVLGTIFVFFMVPETKGKDIDEIQRMLAGSKTEIRNQFQVNDDNDDDDDDIVVIDIKK